MTRSLLCVCVCKCVCVCAFFCAGGDGGGGDVVSHPLYPTYISPLKHSQLNQDTIFSPQSWDPYSDQLLVGNKAN